MTLLCDSLPLSLVDPDSDALSEADSDRPYAAESDTPELGAPADAGTLAELEADSLPDVDMLVESDPLTDSDADPDSLPDVEALVDAG